ncbi:MAG: DUF952 domain-containing protein [Proteobacteria bacterium]|jgi:uncharacterized protein (DUF952 family)|nr:DUF952 domain-containing protein [Pseudomonadota bacterium]
MKRFFWLIVFPLLAACQVNHKNDAYMENRFFKILTPAQWQNFQSERVFLGSELDQQDGFIHLSLQSQWNRIWQKFFNSDECYLLEIDGYSLNPEALKIEANRAGGEKYPHYYGNILLSSVIAHQHLTK